MTMRCDTSEKNDVIKKERGGGVGRESLQWRGKIERRKKEERKKEKVKLKLKKKNG